MYQDSEIKLTSVAQTSHDPESGNGGNPKPQEKHIEFKRHKGQARLRWFPDEIECLIDLVTEAGDNIDWKVIAKKHNYVFAGKKFAWSENVRPVRTGEAAKMAVTRHTGRSSANGDIQQKTSSSRTTAQGYKPMQEDDPSFKRAKDVISGRIVTQGRYELRTGNLRPTKLGRRAHLLTTNRFNSERNDNDEDDVDDNDHHKTSKTSRKMSRRVNTYC